MTNEEARQWFLKVYSEIKGQGYADENEEAYELAIKALEQVSEIEENIIKYMKKYPNHVGNTDFWEGFYACRNVVLQLENEYLPKEQEPCDDAISRQAIKKLKRHNLVEGQFVSLYDIEKLPPVRPQENTGHWEEIVKEHKCYARDDTYTTTEYHCSECGAEPLAEYASDEADYALSNYCPYCGVRMGVNE